MPKQTIAVKKSEKETMKVNLTSKSISKKPAQKATKQAPPAFGTKEKVSKIIIPPQKKIQLQVKKTKKPESAPEAVTKKLKKSSSQDSKK